jgi:hypothetical protein
VNSPDDGPVGPKHVEIRRYMNKIEIVTSVGFLFHTLKRCTVQSAQNRFYENKLFRTDCKKFYNRLRQTEGNVKNAPEKEEVENFRKEIYENKVKHNGEACWIKQKPVPTKSKHGIEPHM